MGNNSMLACELNVLEHRMLYVWLRRTMCWYTN